MKYPKEYLGDGCYVAFDGYQLELTSSDGVRDTNTIYLEPAVYAGLVRYVERLKKIQERPRPEDADNDPDQMIDDGDPAEP